jgi:hypothetical protein
LTKEFKAYIGKKTTPSTNGTGKTGYLHVEVVLTAPLPFTLYKINSNGSKTLM